MVMPTCLIVVPVLARPWRIRPVLESIKRATPNPKVLVVASTHDTAVHLACAEASHVIADMAWVHIPYEPVGDYARKVNFGYLISNDPFLFLAADDLEFHEGWLEAAMAKMADPKIGVVGTQDLCNYRVLQGEHSTHSLMRRTYVDQFGLIDQPGLVLNPDYPHEFVDDEQVATAKFRGAFAFAGDSIVEHLHPGCGKADWDELYSNNSERVKIGAGLYQQRCHLWGCA